MHAAQLLLALTGTAAALAVAAPSSSPPLKRGPTDTNIVYLNQCSGTPQLYAQGVLYGYNANTPPQSYLQELGVNYESAGGAQTDQQPAGYALSRTSYNNRFASVVAVWRRIRQQNGVMIVKMADLWGADFTQGNNLPYPGDNGDWTLFDNFINQVISDVKSSGMALSYSTQLELWNEPDINFGGRPQSQYNAMYVRGTKALRAAFPKGGTFLPLVGPSTSNRPYNGNGWWNSFLSYLQANGGTASQPDVWNWHLEENNNNDPSPPAQYLPGYVQSYGLNTGIGLQNNEFGTRAQQYPGYAVWFRGRYERLKFNGLRGNWASASDLSDLLADLLIRNSDGSYSKTGEYLTYQYAKAMSGSPCTTAPGSNLDSYATAASNNVTVLIGSQSTAAGTWATQFNSVSSKFGSTKTLKAQVVNFAYNGGKAVSTWTNVGSPQTVTVNSNDQVTVNIDVGTTYDAYAIRLTT